MKNPFRLFSALLDDHVFPLIVRYATSRPHVVLMVCLWMALLVCGSFTAFELVGGNYTNGLSGLLGCIILLQQQKHQTATQALHDKVEALHQEQKDLHESTHQRLETLTAKVEAKLTAPKAPRSAKTPAAE